MQLIAQPFHAALENTLIMRFMDSRPQFFFKSTKIDESWQPYLEPGNTRDISFLLNSYTKYFRTWQN